MGGLFWIIASGYISEWVIRVPMLEIVKGATFVLVTGALLYLVLSRAADSIRESQADLVASEERFRSVVENAPVGIFVQTAGQFRYLNAPALKFFGAASIDQLRGQSVFDRLDPAFHQAVKERIRRINENRAPSSLLAEKFLRLDGSSVDVDVSAVPFELEGESGFLVFFIDTSSRVRAEHENRLLEEQFRQAQKMESVGRLAGGIAHDFNNLLTVINGYSALLLERTAPNDRNYDPIHEIHNAGQRAAGITRQLLAFSHRDAIQPKVLDPNQVIREMERMLRRLVGENVRLTTRLAAGAGRVLSDAGWLTQVLLNLAANARDAMPEGGELVVETSTQIIGEEYCRRVAAAHPSKAIRIEVRDTGCGMDDETRERMFEPFFTTKPSGEGTGLGLSIVYGIVHSSGGWLEVESRPKEGTAISIFLPVCEESAEPAASRSEATRLAGHETVLLVEDEEAVRGFAEAVLRGAGYRVIPCASGDEAVQSVSRWEGPIQLLVTDVMMPGMSGTELTQLLAAKLPGIKVVLVSGYSREDLTPSATTSHRAFLSKPFTAVALLETVRQVLDEGEQAAR